MIIDPFVEGEPGVKHFVDLVRVLDIIAYLAFDDACRMDEPGKRSETRGTRVRSRETMYAHLEIEILPLSPTA